MYMHTHCTCYVSVIVQDLKHYGFVCCRRTDKAIEQLRYFLRNVEDKSVQDLRKVMLTNLIFLSKVLVSCVM